jgi:two-component system, chemotaxis family, chemotaxis protein CheY
MAQAVIVDDNLLSRTRLPRILSDGGHEVVGEAPGEVSAPACVGELHPELVTLDLMMSGRGGLATLEHPLMIDPALTVVVARRLWINIA